MRGTANPGEGADSGRGRVAAVASGLCLPGGIAFDVRLRPMFVRRHTELGSLHRLPTEVVLSPHAVLGLSAVPLLAGVVGWVSRASPRAKEALWVGSCVWLLALAALALWATSLPLHSRLRPLGGRGAGGPPS